MKKETIEKLFKRYISIFDDVVNQTTGTHLDQTIVNEINSEVDLLFKEYEQMSNLTEFNSFSEKIQNIINKVLKESKLLNKAFIEKELQKRFNLFESNPFVYIENEVNNTINKIIPNTNGDYYIPANPYLESITRKGYNIIFRSNKIKEHIDKVNEKYKNKQNELAKQLEQEYAVLIVKTLHDLNDYPIQFCKETFEKYFYDKWDSKLLVLPNSIKNYILIDAINLGLKPHTEEYEKAVDLIFTFKNKFENEIKLKWPEQNYLPDLKYNFVDNLISKEKIINDFFIMYSCVYNNEELTKSQKTTLKRKLDILLNNIECMLDISYIRFYKFALEHNLFNLDGEFLTNKANASLVYNMMNINLTLLINELKTVKLNEKDFIINEKYINIINEYYKYVDNIKDLKSYLNNPILKITILDDLVETFNKQYKYKYIFENIKSKIKNIIKIKK